MTITVLYFAALRDAVGVAQEDVELSQAALPVASLLKILAERRPVLSSRLSSLRVAVNESFALASDIVRPGDVIALIPPVAGG